MRNEGAKKEPNAAKQIHKTPTESNDLCLKRRLTKAKIKPTTTPARDETADMLLAVPTGTLNVLAMSDKRSGSITSMTAAAKMAKAKAKRKRCSRKVEKAIFAFISM